MSEPIPHYIGDRLVSEDEYWETLIARGAVTSRPEKPNPRDADLERCSVFEARKLAKQARDERDAAQQETRQSDLVLRDQILRAEATAEVAKRETERLQKTLEELQLAVNEYMGFACTPGTDGRSLIALERRLMALAQGLPVDGRTVPPGRWVRPEEDAALTLTAEEAWERNAKELSLYVQVASNHPANPSLLDGGKIVHRKGFEAGFQKGWSTRAAEVRDRLSMPSFTAEKAWERDKDKVPMVLADAAHRLLVPSAYAAFLLGFEAHARLAADEAAR